MTSEAPLPVNGPDYLNISGYFISKYHLPETENKYALDRSNDSKFKRVLLEVCLTLRDIRLVMVSRVIC